MRDRKFCDVRFNTQPPEGGWSVCVTENFVMFGFNTQPPEGGWLTAQQ